MKNTWTGLMLNKKTGEELSFFIWKDGNKIEFTPEDARNIFPKAMVQHEQTAMIYLIYGA